MSVQVQLADRSLDLAIPAAVRVTVVQRITAHWRWGLGRLLQHRLMMLSMFVLLLLATVAVVGPLAWTASPDTVPLADIGSGNAPFSAIHPLGTDQLGHDTLARLLSGLRVSFEVVVLVEAINVTLGVVLGLLAGYCRGWVDGLLGRVCDILMAFPGILLAILLVGTFGNQTDGLMGGTGRLMLTGAAIALVSWPRTARYVRGMAMGLREQEYVEAARAQGAGTAWIIRSHILPNIAGMIMVLGSMDAMAVVANEATLSLLGLGVQPPHSSLGLMINEAKDQLDTAPAQVFVPCAVIVVLVLTFAFISDGMRDMLDPRDH